MFKEINILKYQGKVTIKKQNFWKEPIRTFRNKTNLIIIQMDMG